MYSNMIKLPVILFLMNLFWIVNSYDGAYQNEDDYTYYPKSYEFGYAVKDHYSGTDYNRQEISDGNKVQGEYRVHLPDGRLQIVTYYADDKTGYHADVRYEYATMNKGVHGVDYSPYKYNDYYKKRKRSI